MVESALASPDGRATLTPDACYNACMTPMTLQNIKTWLAKYLTNEWMNETSFLAPMAHIGWAALIVLSVALLTSTNLKICAVVSAGLVVFAGLKEYVYDANFELPKQTFKDNTEDFVGYLGGLLLAWAVIGLQLYLRGK